jgi:hypothetical protein
VLSNEKQSSCSGASGPGALFYLCLLAIFSLAPYISVEAEGGGRGGVKVTNKREEGLYVVYFFLQKG